MLVCELFLGELIFSAGSELEGKRKVLKGNMFQILVTTVLVFSFCVGFSQKSCAKILDILPGDMIVQFQSTSHLDSQQIKNWSKNCSKLAEKFLLEKGYWKTGIADKSVCILPKKSVSLLDQRAKKTYLKNLADVKDSRRFLLEVKILGKKPKKTTKKEEKGLEKVIGTATSFWEGFKNQVFHQSIDDKRKILFRLSYIDPDGGKYLLSKRIYPYNEKFIGYFDLDGFVDLLAFDILVDAPFQWRASAVKEEKIFNGISTEVKHSIDISNNITDIELNKNIFIVSPAIVGKGLYVAEAPAIPIYATTAITTEGSKESLLTRYLILDMSEKFPAGRTRYLSLGHEPYTRFYAHKKFEYLLRKLDKLNLTFYFAGTSFGVSQILVNNDELSYIGFRYAKALSEKEQLLGTYYNLDLSINKGVTKGLKASLDLWPKSSQIEGLTTLELEAYRVLLGYRYSFLLPITGAVDVTPEIGLWSYDVTASADGIVLDSLKESSALSLGIGFGYSINVFELILSGYAKFSTVMAKNESVSAREFGADIGYRLGNVYNMKSIDPAIYGFITSQKISIVNKDQGRLLNSFKANGLVVGVGVSAVWD